MKAGVAVIVVAFVAWASWPKRDAFPDLAPEDAEALRLLRDLENGRPGAWEAIVRARNPRTVPALILREDERVLDSLLHHPEVPAGEKRVVMPASAGGTPCCRYGQRPHAPADAFESALQAGLLSILETGELKRRTCVRTVCAAREVLEDRLADPEPGVRFAAAVQLWRSGDLPSVPRVRGMLGDHALARYPWLEFVVEFFREERDVGFIRAISRAGNGRGLAAAAFLKLKPAVDDIVQLLNDPKKPERRADAAWALGEIGDSRATPALIDALSSGDYWLTGDAAEALGKIGDRAALPMLRATLDRAGVYGQAEILRVLGALGGSEDVPQVEYYATTDEYTGAIGRRRVALAALEKLRP